MNIDYNVWGYDKLMMFRDKLYHSGLTEEHLTNEELAIQCKDKKYPEFYFVAKKDKCKYLIPSYIIERDMLPIIINEKVKIGVKGKAYYKVCKFSSLKITPERTMAYDEMIDSFLNVEHDKPDLFLLAKIINDCAYDERINVELLTYPGWLKTSLMVCLGILLGHSYCIDKPSYAKLKLFLKDETRQIGLDEINEIEDVDALDLKSYIEATGDFRPEWFNPKRAIEGVKEQCRITNLSTVLFYNFPKSDDENPKRSLRYFNKHLGHPKINRRLLSFLFDGGTEDNPAIKSYFKKTNELTDDEFNFLLKWVKNKLYYFNKDNRKALLKIKGFKRVNKLKNNTWDTNFKTICEHLMLYCYTQEQYEQYEKLLFDAHKKYWNYILSLKNETEIDYFKGEDK